MPDKLNIDSTQTNSPWLRRVAVCLACATFPLIFVGGLVTTTRSGMAVPDWPSTYGYNLFLYPWETWVFGPWKLFVEHGHRLFGSLVGLLAILLVIVAIRSRAPRGFIVGAVVTLLLVCFQGFLGGARVLLESRGILDGRSIAFLHGCTGPIFFAYAVLYAAATSQLKSSVKKLSTEIVVSKLRISCIVLALLALAQLLFGASLRHVPDSAEPAYFRMMTLMHLLFAATLFFQSILVSGRILKSRLLRSAFGSSASILLFTLVVQIALGVLTWVLKYGYPPNLPMAIYFAQLTLEHRSVAQVTVVTAHVANGALVLALAARLAFVTLRYSTLPTAMSAVFLAEGAR